MWNHRPTYRLLIGIPGKSNAFAISGKLGSRLYYLTMQKRLSEQDVSFEDLLSDLEASRRTIEKQLNIAAYKRGRNFKTAAVQNRKSSEQRDRIIVKQMKSKCNTKRSERSCRRDDPQFHKLEREYLRRWNGKERERLRKRSRYFRFYFTENKQPKRLTNRLIQTRRICKVLSMNLTGTIGSLPMQEATSQFRWESSVTSQYFRFGNYRRSIALRTEADEPYGKKQDQDEQVTFCKSWDQSARKTVDKRSPNQLDKYLDDALPRI